MGAPVSIMMQFDQVQKFGKDGMDATIKSLAVVTKGAQTAATEVAAFAKRSMENGSSTLEKLVGARTLDKAFEIQTEFVRTSYEGLVAHASKLGGLYTSTAKEAYAPVEALVAKPAAA